MAEREIRIGAKLNVHFKARKQEKVSTVIILKAFSNGGSGVFGSDFLPWSMLVPVLGLGLGLGLGRFGTVHRV